MASPLLAARHATTDGVVPPEAVPRTLQISPRHRPTDRRRGDRLAVRPDHAGQGLGQRLLGAAWHQARVRGVRHAALVSVQGTRGFWRRQGFAPAAAQPPALASYGADALYMTRTLDG